MIRQHYILAHYLVTLCLVIGYLTLGIAYLAQPDWLNSARHLIAIGGMLTMTYLVLTIAGLRHSHITLNFPLCTRIGFALLLIAAISRSLGTMTFPNLTTLLTIPVCCTVAALLLYLRDFLPIFIRGDI